MKEKNKLLIIRWTMGLFFGLIFWILKLTRRVKVQGYDRRKLDPENSGLILISNHPSFWEPALLPFLFFPWYLLSSRFIPFSIVDKKDYHDKWWFFPFRGVCEPVERGNPKEEIKAIDRMREKLSQNQALILYGEGKRTFRRPFEESWEVKRSESGKVIRKFPQGIRRLFLDISPLVLPVWTEGGDKVIPNLSSSPRFLLRIWRQTIIKIGEPRKLEGISKKKIVETLEDILLNLGER